MGKPIIKGTRIAVGFILDLLANGWSVKDMLKNYPQLKRNEWLTEEECLELGKEVSR